MFNKKISLSIYSLPKTFYVKYSILGLYSIISLNALSILFIYTTYDIRHELTEDPMIMIITLPLTILSIYINLDALHALMKKQFIEVTNKYIRVKKLNSDITLNWCDVVSIEEMYSIRLHILSGVKLKKRDKGKWPLSNRDITINFNKYANIDIEDFFEVLYRKKSNSFRIRF